MTGFLILWALTAAGLALRLVVAAHWFRRPAPPPVAAEVTVLIPILSGDPRLEGCLRQNLTNAPDARFLLLIDDDDPEAQSIAARLSAPNAVAVSYPPPMAGENPKVAKLARALPRVETPLFAVLDDDTVLSAGALDRAAGWLTTGDLVTGLPAYVAEGNLWTRAVAAFVNASVLPTYPVGAALGEQRTLNGMFYLGRTRDLRALGGFDAIRGQLTDDYAMARLYLDAGRRLVQAPVVHPVQTTVTGPGHWLSILRRWMIFAHRYLRENPSAFTLGLIGGTTLAPLVLLLWSLALSPLAVALALALPLAKALILRGMRARLMGQCGPQHGPWSQVPLEALADLLVPLHALSALVMPGRFRWRRRRMRMQGETIRYD